MKVQNYSSVKIKAPSFAGGGKKIQGKLCEVYALAHTNVSVYNE